MDQHGRNNVLSINIPSIKFLNMYKIFSLILFISFCLNGLSQKLNSVKQISSDLFGIFFEDINYAADGGLYAEMVQNRSFEYNPTERQEWHPFSYWVYITPGFSYGNISIETNSPIHPNNPHYIVLIVEHVGNYSEFHGESGVGLKNYGFDGMVIKQGEKYYFSLFAQLLSEKPVELLIALQDRKGSFVSQDKIQINSTSWQKYETILNAASSYDSCSLIVLAQTEGKLALDMISLFPEKTFKNHPNGLRADLAQVIADMKPKFIRFPGGCLVHGDGLDNMYRWKNTIGPVEQRKEQRNIWGYHQTTGLGFFEYFQFCEDIGAKPLPVLPAAVSCQNSGGTWRIGGKGQKALPMEQMPDYIQDVLDLIEWANGPVTSKWGAKRAIAGHPEPFNLEYIGIGNEDKMTPEFTERFTMIYSAIKDKYPNIKVVGTAGPFHSGEDFDMGWELAQKLNVDIIDEHYYVIPRWFITNQHRYDNYNRNSCKVYLGEYASWGNKFWNALAEAAYMTGLERNGDIVTMASYAPLLAKRGFTQWKTDMIFFDNKSICLTPNYHVQCLFMNNQGDIYYENVIHQEDMDTTLTFSCVKNIKSGDIILKIVNLSDEKKTLSVDLSVFKKILPDAKITILTGNREDENTFENPNKVVPSVNVYHLNKKFSYSAIPLSLTIIRIKTRK
jgi:alpha-L-arabinofuranosidase